MAHLNIHGRRARARVQRRHARTQHSQLRHAGRLCPARLGVGGRVAIGHGPDAEDGRQIAGGGFANVAPLVDLSGRSAGSDPISSDTDWLRSAPRQAIRAPPTSSALAQNNRKRDFPGDPVDVFGVVAGRRWRDPRAGGDLSCWRRCPGAGPTARPQTRRWRRLEAPTLAHEGRCLPWS